MHESSKESHDDTDYDATHTPSSQHSKNEIQNDDYLSKNFLIAEQENSYNVFYLKLKSLQIEKILNPLELGDTKIKNLNRIFDASNRKSSEIEIYEEMFAKEISAIYYFNLYNNNLLYNDYYAQDNKTYQNLNINPKKCLFQILAADNEIYDFHLKWKNDIITLNKKIFNDINKIFY